MPSRLSPIIVLSLSSLSACCGHQTAVVTRNNAQPSPSTNQRVEPTVPAATPTPELEVKFGRGLRIVPKDLDLESQKLHYRISLTFPQIEGSKDSHILNLNRWLERLVARQSRWVLKPTSEDLRYYRDKWPERQNTVYSTYELIMATDRVLSIYIYMESEGIGAAHEVQQSFTVNYDLKIRRLLRLADVFRPNPNYLNLVSKYCVDDLTKRYGDSLFKEELLPQARNYQSWNITKEGIRINFDACKVLGCAGGEQSVLMPFADLKAKLKAPSALDYYTN